MPTLTARQIAVLLVFFFSACGRSEVGVDTRNVSADRSPERRAARDVPTPDKSVSDAFAPDAQPESPAPEMPHDSRLARDGEGLRIFSATSGASRPIPFGTPIADTLAMLNFVRGVEPAIHGKNIECGAIYAIWASGLTVWFARDRFAG